jgi:hypothetical protein
MMLNRRAKDNYYLIVVIIERFIKNRILYGVMDYENFEQMERDFPFFYSGKPEDIKLFIRGNDPEKRQKACFAVKGLLEKMLESTRAEGKIKEYEVKVIDLLTENHPEITQRFTFTPFWERIGNKKGQVFIPILHNAGNYPDLPQLFFDRVVPGIFSLTKDEYQSVTNRSKRDCYDILEID